MYLYIIFKCFCNNNNHNLTIILTFFYPVFVIMSIGFMWTYMA